MMIWRAERTVCLFFRQGSISLPWPLEHLPVRFREVPETFSSGAGSGRLSLMHIKGISEPQGKPCRSTRGRQSRRCWSLRATYHVDLFTPSKESILIYTLMAAFAFVQKKDFVFVWPVNFSLPFCSLLLWAPHSWSDCTKTHFLGFIKPA